MSSRIKNDSKINFVSDFDTECDVLTCCYTGLYLALVTCGLTKILVEGSGCRFSLLFCVVLPTVNQALKPGASQK